MSARTLRVLGARLMALSCLVALVNGAPALRAAPKATNGVVRAASAYPMEETVRRLKADIAAKGIRFFTEIDQRLLAADAGIALHPSTLLIFGNPALGAQFMTSNPESGIDWPVRLLVFQDADGRVWVVYDDFPWIAQRHRITDREQQFGIASMVIASITSSVGGR